MLPHHFSSRQLLLRTWRPPREGSTAHRHTGSRLRSPLQPVPGCMCHTHCLTNLIPAMAQTGSHTVAPNHLHPSPVPHHLSERTPRQKGTRWTRVLYFSKYGPGISNPTILNALPRTLQVGKRLRHKRMMEFAKVTQLANAEAGFKPKQNDPRVWVLNHNASESWCRGLWWKERMGC